MATSVKRHTDKTSRRIAKLERELQEAQERISELTARLLIMGAGLGYQPAAMTASGEVPTAPAYQAEATVIPFRRRVK